MCIILFSIIIQSPRNTTILIVIIVYGTLPVGAGAQAATADILQFSRSQGIFGGLTFEGSIIKPRDSLNRAYYGKAVSPLDILVRRNAGNAQAYILRAKLASLQ